MISMSFRDYQSISYLYIRQARLLITGTNIKVFTGCLHYFSEISHIVGTHMALLSKTVRMTIFKVGKSKKYKF